jgi:hypothetical protein
VASKWRARRIIKESYGRRRNLIVGATLVPAGPCHTRWVSTIMYVAGVASLTLGAEAGCAGLDASAGLAAGSRDVAVRKPIIQILGFHQRACMNGVVGKHCEINEHDAIDAGCRGG